MDTTIEILRDIDEAVGSSSGLTDPDVLNITNTQKIIQVIGEETGGISQEGNDSQQSVSGAKHFDDINQEVLAVDDNKHHSPESLNESNTNEKKPNYETVNSSVEQNSVELAVSQSEEICVDLPQMCEQSLTSLKRKSEDITNHRESLNSSSLDNTEHSVTLQNQNIYKEDSADSHRRIEKETKAIQGTEVSPVVLDIEEQPPTKRQKVFHTDNTVNTTSNEVVDLTEDTRIDSTDDLYTAEKVAITDVKPVLKKSVTEDPDAYSSCTGSIYKFEGPPYQLTGAWGCFMSDSCNNYLRGCKWAPDGTCLLTATNDNCVQVFNTPEQLYDLGRECTGIEEMVPVLKMKEADTIYDYCWYSKMSSNDPDKACLAVTSRSTPIHLFDAFTGDLKCSYRAYSQVDELVAAYSLSFDLTGSKLYCGFNKMIRVFDVNRPGREYVNRPTYAKEGQSGIISCIAHSPTETGLYAAGSYARSIALYKETKGEMICMFEGQQGGVTHIMFSPDGTKLYSGGRKDNEILCWDLRNPGQILYTMERKVNTNQRIYFDITQDGRFVISGCHDGFVRVWDTLQSPVQYEGIQEPILPAVMSYKAHCDTVNGVSLHPYLPVVATSSGQRHYPSFNDSSDENTDAENESEQIDNSLKLWRIT